MKNYAAESFKAYYVATIVATIAGFLLALAASKMGVRVDTLGGVVLGAYMVGAGVGIWLFGAKYPTAPKGVWRQIGVGLLSVFRVGWDRPGLKNLPWGVFFTWGLASVVVSPTGLAAVVAALGGHPEMLVNVLLGGITGIIVAIPIAYGIGYSLRWVWEKSRARTATA